MLHEFVYILVADFFEWPTEAVSNDLESFCVSLRWLTCGLLMAKNLQSLTWRDEQKDGWIGK